MRVTKERLRKLLERIAELQNRPKNLFQDKKGEKGEVLFNIGAIKLDYQADYGGYNLVEIMNELGAEDYVSGMRRLTASEMELFMEGMITALEGTLKWPRNRY